MPENAKCLFCGRAATRGAAMPMHPGFLPLPFYQCKVCGSYVVDKSLEKLLKGQRRADAFKIACVLGEKGIPPDGRVYGVFEDHAPLDDPDLAQCVAPRWHISELLAGFPRPVEMLDRALANLARQVDHPLERANIDGRSMMHMLFCGPRQDRLMLQDLCDCGYIGEIVRDKARVGYRITPAGWKRLDEIKTARVTSTTGFVAMWFTHRMQSIYDHGIKAAIEDAGFECRRIDTVQHNNKICDEIIAEIRKSRFVVADFTAGQCDKCAKCEYAKDCREKVRPRGGVYFEAGFALGLGIDVIWTVHKAQIDSVHFDTRQYNHITYDTADELRFKLKNRILATIGAGATSAEEA